MPSQITPKSPLAAPQAADPVRIFDRLQIEGALEDSQHRLSAVFATVQVGIFIIDAQTHTIVDANPKAAAIIGAPLEEIIGAPCRKFVCWEDNWRCPITELGLELDNAERSLLRADGECVTIVKTVAKARLNGREHLVESFLDISERKATELALRQSEERFHDLLDNANDLIQSVDENGSFLYVNRAWKEVLGYTDRELASLKVFDIISPACRDHCSLLFQEILSGRSVSRVDVQFTAKDGRVVELEGSINCSREPGRPLVTRGVFRDITERKAMERELQLWNEQLEQKVEEKTRHLKEAQAKLIQSEKMATLEEVVAGAAHELNNPLAGILGAIQMLRRSKGAQPAGPRLVEGIDVLGDMEQAALRCQHIVDDLIRFSTQARCNFSSMDLNQLLKDTLDIMAEKFAEMSVRVHWASDPALPSIQGDFVKLLEVFVNLLQNARNALPYGGTLEIATALERRYAEQPQVTISIRDNGCGIPPENLPKVFDPFFTTKPAGTGPGLGLTVSYGIIKRHRGDIDIRSSVGKGTEVTVTLPVQQPKG